MKYEEKKLAKKFRLQGYSINHIAKVIKVAKSSVSLWVRDITLTTKQRSVLTAKGISMEVIERRRETRIHNGNLRRDAIVKKAQQDIQHISNKDLALIGASLYWAEGGKTNRGLVRFSNGDPVMITVMMNYFRKICRVSKHKFRGYIHIHPHLNVTAAELYWSKITGIPLKQFFKTYNKINISSKGLKDTLPYGTMEIYICDTELFLKIKGWMEKIKLLSLQLK